MIPTQFSASNFLRHKPAYVIEQDQMRECASTTVARTGAIGPASAIPCCPAAAPGCCGRPRPRRRSRRKTSCPTALLVDPGHVLAFTLAATRRKRHRGVVNVIVARGVLPPGSPLAPTCGNHHAVLPVVGSPCHRAMRAGLCETCSPPGAKASTRPRDRHAQGRFRAAIYPPGIIWMSVASIGYCGFPLVANETIYWYNRTCVHT